jgi:SAM-dependent methyltransferase
MSACKDSGPVLGLTAEEQHWTAISAESYDTAVYTHPMLGHIFHEELEIARSLASASSVVVDVGCGTCMFAGAMTEYVDEVIGVDISRDFLETALRRFEDRTNLLLVHGDASELRDVVRAIRPDIHGPVVACVMNTLGIMPDGVRLRVLREMARLAGSDGTVFLTVFNADNFEEGIHRFYGENPGLCGPISLADVSYRTRELRVADTGYYSHWFSVDELQSLARSAGICVSRLILSGVGIFLVGKGAAT